MNNKKSLKAFDNPKFMHSKEARSIRILSEYIEPEKIFEEQNIYNSVVIFGSARVESGKSKYYDAAEDFAYHLALYNKEIKKETGNDFYICTGGGPGIMEAANKGAHRAKELTIGLNIELPFEQSSNKYISPELNLEFHYFFMRKLWFLYQAKAVIVFPGGFGTLDELFETLTLVQTKKIDNYKLPILLYDKNFWESLINFPKFIEMGLISPEDMDYMHFFDSTKEGLDYLKPKLKEIMENVHKYYEMNFQI